MLAIMGILFIIPTLGVIVYKMLFRIGCKQAQGQVIRIEKGFDEEQGLTSINPIIEFMTFKGEKKELKTGISYGMKYMPNLHDSVKIYYKTNDPTKAQMLSKGLWEVSGILIVTGLFLLLLGIFIN